ncbi:hypothetical protein [Actinomycetospora sp. NBRC 106378]|uniref:hypothetical protein n=1 Tax=Actinomycetospora sp. NBRC 106378 TaxID=3032208 RepID=UPI0024A2253E|nr:hypothetical protein [Actinomycetospora sp. NBRC 106378]GLZ50616.1 hypothetical protein Acsp07_02330 [Actinomycetospora sp. NBRC 106378]
MSGERLVPAGLAVLGALAAVSALVDVAHPLRLVSTVAFGLVGPGWALTALLRPRDLAERAVVAVGAGVALALVVGQAMVVTTAWHPVGALLVLVVLAVPVLVVQALGSRGTRRAVA